MKNSSILKIQVIFIGHLRGTANLDSIKNENFPYGKKYRIDVDIKNRIKMKLL